MECEEIRKQTKYFLQEQQITFQENIVLKDFFEVDFLIDSNAIKKQGKPVVLVFQDRNSFTMNASLLETKLSQRRRQLIENWGCEVIVVKKMEWQQENEMKDWLGQKLNKQN
eukprot:TRINITY_DN45446_c0_g2_i1.p3 TRINITY_DN45446_c0_g2~~TRINITY_DN45446_c0_g2_i1.p3  ORF type:complete len:122 (-),score=22.89 TRINITY_DN45446_c0_g2_i1:155-490(-)